MNKFKLSLIIGFTCLAATSQSAIAETLLVNQQSQQAVDKPRTGQSMQQVESKFGEPSQKLPAIGEPPITRWQYANFTVYFEHDKVIHAVEHRS
ncbi:hypothetical protein [Aliikangiella sp. IMCC44359]|uniref:hypothetical protein n=1 Tax=Aliikangiella sp. IMCC44359 TaxID=3459125 RepID=UPI00403AB40D